MFLRLSYYRKNCIDMNLQGNTCYVPYSCPNCEPPKFIHLKLEAQEKVKPVSMSVCDRHPLAASQKERRRKMKLKCRLSRFTRDIKELVTKKTRQTMKLINRTGLMECRVCGHRHMGWYIHQSWECSNGCRMEVEKKCS